MSESLSHPTPRAPASRTPGGVYAARVRLVRDPATPAAIAMSLVAGLFWRDLLRIAEDPRLHPPLRRRAESLLAERAVDLTEGELVALARVATRSLVGALAAGGRGARVISALLGNPRLLEDDVVALCRRSDDRGVLGSIAACARWRGRRAVRVGLARNPATPSADALRTLEGLSAADLRALAHDATVPTLVRVGAARRVGESAS